MYSELLEKLPKGYITRQKVEFFTSEAAHKFIEGQKVNYDDGKQFDPLKAAQEECLDSTMYSMLLFYRIEALKERLNGLGSNTGN